MMKETINILLWIFPLIVGGIIAAINSVDVNDSTEKVESWTRRMHSKVALKSGWFYNLVINPLLWIVVKFCDWTDSFVHRGLKNGVRVAATLYLIAIWCFLLYLAFMVIVIVVVVGVVLYIIFKVFLGSNEDVNRGYEKGRRVFQSSNSNQDDLKDSNMGISKISIKIINYDGDPCSKVKVALSGQGSYFQQGYTDSNGWAYFQYSYLLDYNMDVSVEVDGKYMGDQTFSNGGTASFTID